MLQSAPETLSRRQGVLIRAAMMLHRYGTPSHRLERVMKRVSFAIGVEADYLYTPTALFISFGEGLHRTELRRIDAGPANLGKLIEFDMALEDLEHGRLGIEETDLKLQSIDNAPQRYSFFMVVLASAISCGCATTFFGGGWREVVFSMVVGALLQLWDRLLKYWAPQEHALEITAGFLTAMAALVVSVVIVPFDDRTAAMGSLIILVPGFSFTVALTELANRHLSSGVARLAGAAVVFLALICGVALAWRLGSDLKQGPVVPIPLPSELYALAVFIAPFSFAVLFQARKLEWGVIAIVAWCGFGSAILATNWRGIEFGAFSGALALGAASNLYARLLDRPALIPQMPATLMLVPGSLGYRSLAAFVDQKGIEGIESAFSMSIVAISIVGGLLAANLVVPPRRIL